MSFWRRIFGMAEESKPRSAIDDFWYAPIGAAGVIVNADTAMRVAAVYACVRIIAETVASLPLHVYRRLPDGKGKERADHPVADLLHNKPNRWQTAMGFREMLAGHLVLRGNAYAEIVWNLRGNPAELIPLHPDRVEVSIRDDNSLSYKYTDKFQRKRTLAQDQVLHLRGLSDDGVMGLSPLNLAGQSIGLSVQVDKFGFKYFQNYARPSGALKLPAGKHLTEDAARQLKADFEAKYGGENAHRVAVFEDGMEWVGLSVNAEDAQFLETRKFQVNEIARIFRVPPHMIADLEKATFSNIEHQGLEFVIHTIRPWLVRIEQAYNLALFTDAERRDLFTEHLVDGLLRGDIAARYDAYGKGIKDGWLTRNEARSLENLNPIDGLDEPLVPLNMATLDQAAAAAAGAANGGQQ